MLGYLRVPLAVREEGVHNKQTKILCIYWQAFLLSERALKEDDVKGKASKEYSDLIQSNSFRCHQNFLYLKIGNGWTMGYRSMFTFSRYCQTAFQSFGINSHSHQHCKIVLVAPHLHQHLALSVWDLESWMEGLKGRESCQSLSVPVGSPCQGNLAVLMHGPLQHHFYV